MTASTLVTVSETARARKFNGDSFGTFTPAAADVTQNASGDWCITFAAGLSDDTVTAIKAWLTTATDAELTARQALADAAAACVWAPADPPDLQDTTDQLARLSALVCEAVALLLKAHEEDQ